MLEHTDHGYRFVYRDTEQQVRFVNALVPFHAYVSQQYFSFRHPFISKLLGLHLQAIVGSVGMGGLGPEEDFRPVGALVVCCVAVSSGSSSLYIPVLIFRKVHRALKLYASGSPPKSIGDFSADSVLSARDEFSEFIDVDGEIWEKVLEEASKHVPKGSCRSTMRHAAPKAAAPKRATVRGDPVA